MSDQTTKNLRAAFAGESKANRQYLAYAQKAEEEGFGNLARLFRAIAESETVHAINHLKCVGVGSSLENVEASLKGETDEFTSMYPMFMDQAKRDTNNDALKSFFWANEAEKVHADFYDKSLTALKQGKDIEIGDLHVCSVCGNTVEGTPPEKCPVCGESGDRYFQTA
ncbi:MAG: rubrerythrin [Nitrospira bacterium SG8_35_4]|nr:MAG: rubrerythrin [Nitrospira bacterium SG8_35_4]